MFVSLCLAAGQWPIPGSRHVPSGFNLNERHLFGFLSILAFRTNAPEGNRERLRVTLGMLMLRERLFNIHSHLTNSFWLNSKHSYFSRHANLRSACYALTRIVEGGGGQFRGFREVIVLLCSRDLSPSTQ